ncbi:hypothetical protein J6W78_07560 [bacterium]|nr:hypothetical protein [bacterium]
MDNMSENTDKTENNVLIERETVEITVKDIIRILHNNKKLFFVSSFIAFAVLSFVFLFLLTPVYDVNSSVEIRAQQSSPSFSFDAISMLMGGGISNDKSIDLELLKSRTIMDAIIANNELRMNVRRKNNTMFAYIWNRVFGSLPEDAFIVFKKIPEPLKSKKAGLVTASEEGFTIEFDGEKTDCQWDKDCNFKGGILAVEKLGTFSFPLSYKFEYEPLIMARERMGKTFAVSKSAESDTLTLVLTHESPVMSVKILNDVVELYIQKKTEWEEGDARSKKEYITKMLDELSLGIDEKSRKMIEFQQQEKTIMPEVEVPELLKKQETLRIQIEEFKFKKQILVNTLKSVEGDPGKPITIPIEEASVQEALKYHNSLLFKRNEMSQRLTEEHPLKVAADEEIKESEQALKNVIKTSIAQYEKGEKLLNDLLGMIMSGQGKIPETLFTFANLKRDVELAEKVYVTLSAKLYESSVSPNVGIVPVRVIDSPDPNVLRSFPKVKVFAMIIVMFSTFFGFFMVFVKEILQFLKESLKQEDDDCSKVQEK